MWLGVWGGGCVNVHRACVQPQVGTPGADLPAWCWVLSQGGGACGPGSQPSLPDSASSPPSSTPGPSGSALWFTPSWCPLFPSGPMAPWGTRVGTQLTEANSDFADSTCSPPPLGLASRGPPQPGRPSLSAQLGLHPTPGGLGPGAERPGLQAG